MIVSLTYTAGTRSQWGLPGGAYGAGGRTIDPGMRYKGAIQQGANALLGVLTAPGGDAPGGGYRQTLIASARAAAAARADLAAERSLAFTGYGDLSRGNAATRAEAARLAARLGLGPLSSGQTATTGWPPRGRGATGDPVPPSVTRLWQGNTRAFNPLLNVAQWYQAFGYDPAGPSLLNVAMRSPENALWARIYASRARSNAKKNFPNLPAADSARDAFRHAYWNLRMARTLGPETAQRFADSREIGSTNTAGSRLMDLWNNFVGRRLAADAALAGQLPADAVLDAIRRRALQTQPFTVRNGIPSP